MGGMSLDRCSELDVLQKGHINVQKYRDDLLEPIIRLYAVTVSEKIIVMHVNALPHAGVLGI